MLDKNLFRLFTNSMILITLGLFFNIKTIRAEKYNKCYSLYYTNFEQYYRPWKYDEELYLEKYGDFLGSQVGFGNIEELIDFKRSFYLKLIDNYNWFFDFDEFDSLNKKLKGNLIIGGEPHEIYPNKYPFKDLESTSSYKTGFTGRSWRLLVDKIFIDKSNSISIPSRIITFNYEIYKRWI